MTASDLFGVIVRTIGLLMLLAALWQIAWALLNLVGGGPGNAVALLLGGVPTLLLGWWFLRGARRLVSYAYAEE